MAPSEDVPADSAGDAPSESQLPEDHISEDSSELGGTGASAIKKDIPATKLISDGKLVKGRLVSLLKAEMFLVGMYLKQIYN